jgi:hypothetical protein
MGETALKKFVRCYSAVIDSAQFEQLYAIA